MKQSVRIEARHTTTPVIKALIQRFLDIVGRIKVGSISVRLPDGSQHLLKGNAPGPFAEIELSTWEAVRRLLTQGDLGFVEAYVDGDWVSPDPSKVIEIGVRNREQLGTDRLQTWVHKVRHRIAHLMRPNNKKGARRNIAEHYDLGNEFYKQWLDPTMTYSSGYFETEKDDLNCAQLHKYRRIADILELSKDHHVLEIGCGWGGFAEFATKEYGCRLTGLTLSAEQLDYARVRAKREGFSDKANFRLQDYRDTDGTFDRIASIEMFEAVGEDHWPRYFETVRDRLVNGGVAALQIITINEERFAYYRNGADFIQRYIFPGGMLPSMAALTDQVKESGLQLASTFSFGPSYAQTLHQWREQFMAAWSKIEPLGFDQRFKRMWEMYLAYCEGGFRGESIDVVQLKLIRP